MEPAIAPETTPVFGCSQPGCGQRKALPCPCMPAKNKLVSHAATVVRDAMVANLAALIEKAYPNLPVTAAYEKIEARTGYSLSTLQRIMSGNTGPSIDTLADLAHHLGTSVPELLTRSMDDRPSPRPVTTARTPRSRGARELQRRSGD